MCLLICLCSRTNLILLLLPFIYLFFIHLFFICVYTVSVQEGAEWCCPGSRLLFYEFILLIKTILLDNITYSSYFSQFRSIGSSLVWKCGEQCTSTEENRDNGHLIFFNIFCVYLFYWINAYWISVHWNSANSLHICYYCGIAVLYQRKKQTNERKTW